MECPRKGSVEPVDDVVGWFLVAMETFYKFRVERIIQKSTGQMLTANYREYNEKSQ